MVRSNKNVTNPQKSLNRATYIAGVLTILGSATVCYLIFGGFKQFIPVVIGLVVGLAIGTITEIFTSDSYKYVKEIAFMSLKLDLQQLLLQGWE